MKEQIKAPEIIQLSSEQIANLSDAQFKTLVIRMLAEMVEYGHILEGKIKAMKSEIKEPRVKGKKLGLKDLEQKEEISIQLEQNEETEFKKMRRGLGTSGTTLSTPISES